MEEKKYFELYDHKIVYTDDCWTTYNVLSCITPDSNYHIETNRDIIAEITLKEQYGDEYGSLIINEFKIISDKYYNIKKRHLNINEGYGSAFEIFSVAVIHNESYENVINNFLVDGSDDGKIDAIYYNDFETIFYQIKKTMVNDNVYEEMINNISYYRENKRIDKKNTKDLEMFLNLNWDKLCNNTNYYKLISENSKIKQNIKPHDVYLKFLENKFIYEYNISDYLKIPRNKKNNESGFNVAKLNDEIYFTFVKAIDLMDNIESIIKNESELDQLFIDNVRGSLGNNNSMIHTLKNEPEMFCYYNNGISILGSEIIDNEYDFDIKIKNPKIINGQQTVRNLYSQRNNREINFEEVYIPVFIKKFKCDTMKINIAKYNNSQNKISSVDLLSLNNSIRNIQHQLLIESFKNKSNCYYLKINTSGKQYLDRIVKKTYGNRVIQLKEFIKLYSVLEDRYSIGEWKNNYNKLIEKNYSKGFPEIDIKKAIDICSIIVKSKELIKINKSHYQIADLAIQYLLTKTNEENVLMIIDKINQDSVINKRKMADIYKSNQIIQKLEEHLNLIKDDIAA